MSPHPFRRRRRRTLVAAASALAAAALLAACTSGTTGTGGSLRTSSQGSTTPWPGVSATPSGAPASPASTSGATGAPATTAPNSIVAPPPTSRPSPTTASRGLAPVITRVPTSDRVVFLTIDDGYERDPAFAAYVQENRIPLTQFLVSEAAAQDQAFFAELAAVPGGSIQNHSISHPRLPSLGAAGQTRQICGAAASLGREFGTRPTMLRPPYGAYDTTTRRVAVSCGMSALVLWSASMPSSKLYYAQGSRLRPGDIVLLHFRPENGDRNLRRLLGIVREQGFQVGSLTDYLT